jgi:hypothetical protein
MSLFQDKEDNKTNEVRITTNKFKTTARGREQFNKIFNNHDLKLLYDNIKIFISPHKDG